MNASANAFDVFGEVLGYNYIERAFRLARQHAPDATLMLNDAGILANPNKVSMFLAVYRDLLSRGAPLDGVGIQAHIQAEQLASLSQ